MWSRASRRRQRSQGAGWRRMKDGGAGGVGAVYRASMQEVDMASGAREQEARIGAPGAGSH